MGSGSQTLTIGRLARAAGVGVETIRYYQKRHLLPVPSPDATATYRQYPVDLVQRIQFIKRAQELGFSIQEVSDLLKLEDGADRASIRRIASARLDEIAKRLDDLKRMKAVLSRLI